MLIKQIEMVQKFYENPHVREAGILMPLSLNQSLRILRLELALLDVAEINNETHDYDIQHPATGGLTAVDKAADVLRMAIVSLVLFCKERQYELDYQFITDFEGGQNRTKPSLELLAKSVVRTSIVPNEFTHSDLIWIFKALRELYPKVESRLPKRLDDLMNENMQKSNLVRTRAILQRLLWFFEK